MFKKTHFQAFLRDETGAVTVDSVVVLGGSMMMGLRVVMDISVAVVAVAQMTGDHLGSDEFYEAAMAAGSGSAYRTAVEATSGPTSGTGNPGNPGNPGNDKDVGRAGENPNGNGGWGNGSRGRSQ